MMLSRLLIASLLVAAFGCQNQTPVADLVYQVEAVFIGQQTAGGCTTALVEVVRGLDQARQAASLVASGSAYQGPFSAPNLAQEYQQPGRTLRLMIRPLSPSLVQVCTGPGPVYPAFEVVKVE